VKKLLMWTLAAATLAPAAMAQQPMNVLVININRQLVSALQNFAGFNPANPYAEVLILNPSASVDGYRIHLTFTDSQGVTHDILRDSISQPAADGRPIMEVFWIDAATVSATVTPYKLQTGAVTAP
jgi:hypothetical protein